MAQLSSLTPDLKGRKYESFNFFLDPQWVSDFIKHTDCLASEIPEGRVPASFLSCMRHSEFHIFNELGVGLNQLLHASQKFKYFKDLRLNTYVSSCSEITRLSHRKINEELRVFMEVKTTFSSQSELIAETLMSVIVSEEGA